MIQVLFFVGKGGVGKSTTSALTALALAQRGRQVHLVSLDPAHNQSDLFEKRFSEAPRRVAPGLRVSEIDATRWTSRYLRQTREALRKNYLYETAFGLQGHFKILQYSPGIEELSLLMAFEHTLDTTDAEILVVDMAPTAVALRFFSMPFTTLAWVEELLKLRELICKKKEIIVRIRDGCNGGHQGDRVSNRLAALLARYRRLGDLFVSEDVRVQLVVNPDRLSVAEGKRIAARLRDIGIHPAAVVVNKGRDGSDPGAMAGEWPGMPMLRVPASPAPLIGIDPLRAFAAGLGRTFPEPAGPVRTRYGTVPVTGCRWSIRDALRNRGCCPW